MTSRHKTKIVCTIGPASDSPDMLDALLKAGMNVARLNFSHGEFEGHAQTIQRLRAASARTGIRLAIMADLPGPKMRIGELAEEPIELGIGDPFTLTTETITGDRRRVSVTLDALPKAVKPGDKLFLNDGLISLRVEAVTAHDVHCEVRAGGELRSRKGLNLPGIDLGMSAFTERDKDCLAFAIEQGVDAVSQSFVSGPQDLHDLRAACDELGGSPFIIAKIERAGALDILDDILDAADGLMVARGDLGVEIPISRMAVVQKNIMRKANERGKPVITATQMLESMTEHRRPTRAEATDVANAILDGTDAVMLSGESAMGRYPVPAVEMLADIARDTEPQLENGPHQRLAEDADEAGLIAHSLSVAVTRLNPVAVVIPTRSGSMARNVAKFRLPVWVTAFSTEANTCQALQFSYGVHPIQVNEEQGDWMPYTRDWLMQQDLCHGHALMTQGPSPERPCASHRMEIMNLDLSTLDACQS